MSSIGEDLERIVPDSLMSGDAFDRETLAIHLERYRWATRFAKGRHVLDLACGVGYGSEVLSRAGALQTLGVDVSPEAIAYASNRYGAAGLRYESHDAFDFVPKKPFGLVVSFETIEHVSEPARLLEHLARCVAPGGTFIGSVPITVSTDANPFHLHDFTETEFVDLVRRAGLVPTERFLQTQRFSPFVVLRRTNQGSRQLQLRRNLMRHYLRFPNLAVRRAIETLRYGFCNRYLIIAAQKPAAPDRQ